MGLLFKYMLPKIIAYENGEMTDEGELIALFQELVDSGIAWELQGHYSRVAQQYIDCGKIIKPDPAYIWETPVSGDSPQSFRDTYFGGAKKNEDATFEDTPEKEARLQDVLEEIKKRGI
jgi:hypothetical protein